MRFCFDIKISHNFHEKPSHDEISKGAQKDIIQFFQIFIYNQINKNMVTFNHF